MNGPSGHNGPNGAPGHIGQNGPQGHAGPNNGPGPGHIGPNGPGHNGQQQGHNGGQGRRNQNVSVPPTAMLQNRMQSPYMAGK